MKRAWVLVPVIAALLVTTGCPFDSDVPLGSPGTGSMDPQLKGRWVASALYHPALEIDVLPFNNDEYYVEAREKGKEPERYRAYTVRIGGEPFLNVRAITSDGKRHPFYFARYTVRPDDTMVLRFVGDKAIPRDIDKDSKALAKFLAAHLEGTALDDPEGPSILRRASTPPTSDARPTP